MNTVDSKELIEEFINNNEMVLVCFGSNICGVCVDMKPKVKKLLEKYPKVKSIYVDVEKLHKVAISYNFFTIPGILLFVEGKETIREARHISMKDIDMRISRYYNLVF